VNWTWNRKKEVAARLLADGSLTATEIAQQLGVSRETIRFWKRSPEFVTRIEQCVEAYRRTIEAHSIALSLRRQKHGQKATKRAV
jgi:DNA-binding CsgD family transcriptional regulator